MFSSLLYSALLFLSICSDESNAFSRHGQQLDGRRTFSSSSSSSFVRPSPAFAVSDSSSPDVVFIDGSVNDNDDDNDEDDNDRSAAQNLLKQKSSRWARLDPKIKAKIIKKGQERAISNKTKREPIQDKKRRLLKFVKEKQQEKKRASRVPRLLSFDERTPLSALIPGMEMNGLIISLTNFGAYIDVGTEVDGLLHVSQIDHSVFIEHPRQILTPGEEVTVRVRSLNVDKKKLHLTMLPAEVLKAEEDDKNDKTERIQLDEIMVDDELWGEVRRVTDYGAYVEVGAAVDGWLHFMDHPLWERGAHPSEFMKLGERVRVW
eukprot:CAMPEP_0198143362 /NCGR_PEP_ID=MMETSP1443-20131203/6771_1 /TAXON_ID=186043 /ORGANISM="Entomoneis sp., Strain CCMP2396" /LENGTH=318 /DNA_ID=CAMNT_0043806587 /DNA_START=82 /DNA_END=1035 /DNA_ORIENTATION=+